MTWRRANAMLAVVWAFVVVAMLGLWAAAWLEGFIGDTAFIGHVSMLALVLASVSMTMGAIAAWRADS